MKRWRYILYKVWALSLLPAAAFWVTGCDVHELPDEPEPTDNHVAVTLHLNFDTDMPLYREVIGTRIGRSAEEYDTRYLVNVYPNDSRAESRVPGESLVFTQPGTGNPDYEATLQLKPGAYKFIVWSDRVTAGTTADLHYQTADFQEIALDGHNGRHAGSDESRDAFRGICEETIPEAAEHHIHVAMARPTARFEFVTTDWTDDFAGCRVRFLYTGYMPCSFNMFTDRPADSRTGVWFDSTIEPTSGTEAVLGFDYVFVNGSEASVAVAIEIYSAKGERIAASDVIDVPLVRGRLTVVRGEFLTAQGTGGIGIRPDFDGDYNIEIQ